MCLQLQVCQGHLCCVRLFSTFLSNVSNTQHPCEVGQAEPVGLHCTQIGARCRLLLLRYCIVSECRDQKESLALTPTRQVLALSVAGPSYPWQWPSP